MTAPFSLLSTLGQQRLALEARHHELRRLYRDLHSLVLSHRARLSWQPEVKAVLETLQTREHERAVGAYEQMLTALLQDVLPGPREVVMDLYTHAGLPALDIYLRKGLGQPLEDALHGTGGSVSNVLSAGLRAIALIRSGKRRFLVLDEADCWIRPLWAPRFASVIQQMAQQMGVQVLMISHHDESLFPMLSHRLRLEKHAQGLAAQWSPSSEAPRWEEQEVGLRSITLEDVQSHRSTHLPLAPGVTLLCGDNDIGKSAVVTALRAVFLGEANDTIIRHHQKSARVTLDFGPDHVLRWERHAKGKVKESYRHYSLNGETETTLHASNGAKAVPDWVTECFSIGLIDGLDVQIGLQKDPIFLLNKPSTARAKALAIGQDSGHVQAMMAIDKRENADAKAAIKQGEHQLEQLSRSVQALKPLVDRRAEWELLENTGHQLSERQAEIEHARQVLSRWRMARARVYAMAPMAATAAPLAPTLCADPRLQHVKTLWRGADVRLRALAQLGEIPAVPLAPRTPPLVHLRHRWRLAAQRISATRALVRTRPPEALAPRPTEPWLRLAKRWRAAQERQAALVGLAAPTPVLPALSQHSDVLALSRRWRAARAADAQTTEALACLNTEAKTLGHTEVACPTCGRPWSPSPLRPQENARSSGP